MNFKVVAPSYEAMTDEQLEREYDYAVMALRFERETAYGVGRGRIVNHKGYVKRNVAEVRAEALEAAEMWVAKIDAIIDEQMKREGVAA